MLEAYSQQIRRQKHQQNSVHRYLRHKKLYTVFRFLFSGVIVANLIILLLLNPSNDPEQATTLLVKWLDITCTIIFMLEVCLKIVALGFVRTSIRGSKPFLYYLINWIDLLLIIVVVIDLSEGLISVRTFSLLILDSIQRTTEQFKMHSSYAHTRALQE